MRSKHIIGIIVIIVIIGIFFSLGRDDTDQGLPTPDEVVEQTNAITQEEKGNKIVAVRQSPGTTVTIDSVTLLAPGYTVAHKETEGAPGEVIGHSSLLPSGTTVDVTFELDEELAIGEQLFLMLHTDDGNGSYEFPGDDSPLTDAEENIVMTLVDITEEVMMEESKDDGEAMEDTSHDGDAVDEASTVVEVNFTSSGFVPKSVEISLGDTVRWINNSSRDVWPATAIHPTHTIYPEKSTDDCLGSSFDACAKIAPGSTWEFTFNEEGSWNYHDHLNAGKRGTVIVN